jgi:hypothetical protein
MSMAVAVMMVGVVAMLVVVMVLVVTMVVMRGMIVMVMVVIMTVMVIVMVAMIVVVMPMIMMRMVIVPMRMTGVGIGAAFGIERRLDLDHPCAEPLHHRLDDVIPADAQALGHDLRRQMPVAEMPRDADQMMRIVAADLQQWLGCGNHLDQPAILQHERIAAAKRDGVFQVEQEFEAAGAGHSHATAVPVVEIEHDGVRRRLDEAVLSADLCRPDHALYPVTESRPSRA